MPWSNRQKLAGNASRFAESNSILIILELFFLSLKVENPEDVDVGEISLALGASYLGRSETIEELFSGDRSLFTSHIINNPTTITKFKDILQLFHQRIIKRSQYEADCIFLQQMYEAMINKKRTITNLDPLLNILNDEEFALNSVR